MSGDSFRLSIRFVLGPGQSETNCSDDLAEAFDQSQIGNLNPFWVNTEECLQLNPGKRDVFVLDPFDGPHYDHLAKFKCTVVGPRCLLTCLNKGEPVPELPYPVFTAAMKDCVVTSTGFGKEKKKEVQQKVERMGGIYSNAFHDAVTHLVAEAVRSQKYDVAVKKDIPVMTQEWVQQVWERGKEENIHATDPQFSKFKCPALMGITFSVSQMNKKDKELMKKSIESHGGIYSGVLDMESTTILIITKPEGDKYKYARKWRIPCLTSDFVFDSIERGFCLSTDGYRVDTGLPAKERASTPTRADETAVRLNEVSMCSTIMQPNDTTVMHQVNETVAAANATGLNATSLLGGPRSNEQLMSCLMDSTRVKRAGAFLDDLQAKVVLSGFGDESHIQALKRVLGVAGATCMSQINKTVTHIIVGQRGLDFEHRRILRQLGLAPHQVGLQWMVESMQMSRPVPESDFPAPSVSSKASASPDEASILKAAMGPMPKVAKSNVPPPPPPPAHADDEGDDEDDLMAAYRNTTATSALMPEKPMDDDEVQFKVPTASSTKIINIKKGGSDSGEVTLTQGSSQEESQVDRFLIGKKLALVGFTEEVEQELSDWVGEAGGEIAYIDFDGVLDFLVVPLEGIRSQRSQSNRKAKEIVSSLWLDECLDKGELCPIEYYHRPLDALSEDGCCDGIVIGISNYSGRERQYLTAAAESLGMIAQEVFAKKDKNSAKKSTHLVCSGPTGNKYEHGLKWGLPIVSKDWVVACLAERRLVSEKPFLVGDSTVFDKDKPLPRAEKKPEPFKVPDTVMSSGEKQSESPKVPQIVKEDSPETPKQPKSDASKRDPDDDDVDSLDIEKLRPAKHLDLLAHQSTTPSRYMMPASQASPAPFSTPGAESQGSRQGSGVKRKRGADDDGGGRRDSLPHFLAGVKTPETPYGGPEASSKSRKYWKKVYDDLGKHKWSEEKKLEHMEHMRRAEEYKQNRIKAREESQKEFAAMLGQDASPNSLNAKDQEVHAATVAKLNEKGIPVLEEDGKSFDELMEEKMRKIGKSWKDPLKSNVDLGSTTYEAKSDDRVFSGVVVYVTKKCEAYKDEIHTLTTELGGEIRHIYGSEVTHVIFQGRKNDSTKEFRIARDEGKHVVAPQWVGMCKEVGERIEESAFAHTYNPKMALSMSVTASKRTKLNTSTQEPEERVRQRQSSRSKQPQKISEETSEEDEEAKPSSPDRPKPESKAAGQQDLSAQLSKLDQLVDSKLSTSESSSGEKKRRSSSIRMALTSTDSSPATRPNGKSNDKENSDGNGASAFRASADSQQVKWVDPSEEAEKQKLEAKMAKETQAFPGGGGEAQFDSMGTMELPTNLTEAMMEDDEGSSSSKPKCFMMSGVGKDDQESFFSLLDQLGVAYSHDYDTNATHVVAMKISRSEKMLGSIAKGMWVLHGSYMANCIKAGSLLPEGPYEWGGPDNEFVEDLSSNDARIAVAAAKSRRALANGAPPVFNGMRVIVLAKDERKVAFQRLLELGGAEVLYDAKPPFSQVPEGTTHMVAQPEKVRVSVDYESLAKRGVAVVSPIYINEYLIADPRPRVDTFLVEPFKAHWTKRQGKR